MDFFDAIAIVMAGLAAGTINTIVGSGSLITFPTLLALGYAPVVANVSNNVGLVPGSVSGVWGYRHELRGQRSRLVGLALFSVVGGLTGGVALLALPSAAFDAIVPILIALAMILVLVQPRVAAWLARRGEVSREKHPALKALIFGTGVYGGYFGAAQGVILIGLLGIMIPDSLQRLNALKNVLAGLVNLTAAVFFVIFADVDWAATGLIALGAGLGGHLGARYGRRLPDGALRGLIVVVGTTAIVRLVFG